MTLTKSSASQPCYLAALDQGTTSTRFIIFDRQGASLVCAQEEHPQHLPQPGWVEHNPLDILHNAIRVIDAGLAESGLQPGDIACMGITNQRETSVVWDRHTGQPVYNAIVWQDTRVADAVARLKNEGVESLIRAKSGLPLSTYFSALKIAWILDHVSGARSRAERGDLLFGNIDAYLMWHFTGGKLHITDVTNASRTQLMDLRTCEWDDELLSLFAIPRAMLPQIRPSSNVHLCHSAAKRRDLLLHAGTAEAPLSGLQKVQRTGNSKSKRRFPSGMTTRIRSAFTATYYRVVNLTLHSCRVVFLNAVKDPCICRTLKCRSPLRNQALKLHRKLRKSVLRLHLGLGRQRQHQALEHQAFIHRRAAHFKVSARNQTQSPCQLRP